MKALVDCDVLVYRCGFAAQHTYYRVYLAGEEEFGHVAQFEYKKEADAYLKEQPEGKFVCTPWVYVEPVENALHNFKQVMEKIKETTKATEIKAYLTGGGNFREKLAVIRPYKGNRDPNHKPFHYQALRDYAVDKWGAEVVEGQEADDAMGIEQYNANTYRETGLGCYVDFDVNQSKSIICTNDKDLNMIPGWHFNFVKDEKYWVSEEEGTRFFYQQLLSGDPTDNIVGIPGIGPKKAEKILADVPTDEAVLYKACLVQYEGTYGAMAEDILIENARLLWIRREPEQVWNPTE